MCDKTDFREDYKNQLGVSLEKMKNNSSDEIQKSMYDKSKG